MLCVCTECWGLEPCDFWHPGTCEWSLTWQVLNLLCYISVSCATQPFHTSVRYSVLIMVNILLIPFTSFTHPSTHSPLLIKKNSKVKPCRVLEGQWP